MFIAQFVKMSMKNDTTDRRTEEYVYDVVFRGITGNKIDIPVMVLVFVDAIKEPISFQYFIRNVENSELYSLLTIRK